MSWVVPLLLVLPTCLSEVINFQRIGGIPLLKTYDAALHNFNLFNTTLSNLQPGDTFFIPNTSFTLIGGITARGLNNVTFLIDGTLLFSDDRTTWPTNGNGDVLECIYLENISNIIFTSSGKGTLDGIQSREYLNFTFLVRLKNFLVVISITLWHVHLRIKVIILTSFHCSEGNGKKWWGAIDFLKHQEDRPRLLHIKGSQSVLVENLLFKDSPYWTFYAEGCNGLVIRYCEVDARWTNQNYHTVGEILFYG
jgi:polygalacturonase